MSRWSRKLRSFVHDNRGFLMFMLGLGCFRLAIADWNPIPSGSMRPTLLEGDVVLVNRVAYDLKLPFTHLSLLHTGDPQRGDIITFSSPANGQTLIKRLVGLPGDTIALHDDVLYINGRAAEYLSPRTVQEPVGSLDITAIRSEERLPGLQHAVQTLPTLRAMRDFGPITVPSGEYFFLGDNRDNSADSRYIGCVPRSHLIGRAHHVLVSANILDAWQPRLSRFGERLD